MKVTRENFTMTKVKIKGGEVSVTKTENGSNNGQVNQGSGTITYTSEPHPDLVNAIRKMQHYLHIVYPFVPNVLPKVSVSGVSLSGSGENRGMIILGTYETPSGRKTALNSDRIPFTGIAYGWEEELEPLFLAIENEVYSYIEEGKSAELKIPFEDDTEE